MYKKGRPFIVLRIMFIIMFFFFSFFFFFFSNQSLPFGWNDVSQLWLLNGSIFEIRPHTERYGCCGKLNRALVLIYNWSKRWVGGCEPGRGWCNNELVIRATSQVQV